MGVFFFSWIKSYNKNLPHCLKNLRITFKETNTRKTAKKSMIKQEVLLAETLSQRFEKVLPHLSEEVRAKLGPLSQEQKDAVWGKISGGNDTIDLPGYIRLTTGIYTHALAQGVSLENLRKYNEEWRQTFSL